MIGIGIFIFDESGDMNLLVTYYQFQDGTQYQFQDGVDFDFN